jgi:hypothetical protein
VKAQDSSDKNTIVTQLAWLMFSATALHLGSAALVEAAVYTYFFTDVHNYTQ